MPETPNGEVPCQCSSGHGRTYAVGFSESGSGWNRVLRVEIQRGRAGRDFSSLPIPIAGEGGHPFPYTRSLVFSLSCLYASESSESRIDLPGCPVKRGVTCQRVICQGVM